jgi:dipeptidase
MELDELPFSVKPDEKVSLQTISALYRATYEGTPYDMTQNIKMVKKRYEDRKVVGEDTIISPVAHPWPTGDFRNTINYLAPGTIAFQRTVAVSWCSYSHIIQLRDWLPDEVGGVVWFAFDNPAESPRIPIFAGTSDLPESFNYCGQKRFREDAALWNYRKANKLATVSWGKTKDTIEEAVLWFEEKAADELPLLENKAAELLQEGKKEETAEYLKNYTRDFEAATKTRWERLEARFWEMFGRGF